MVEGPSYPPSVHDTQSQFCIPFISVLELQKNRNRLVKQRTITLIFLHDSADKSSHGSDGLNVKFPGEALEKSSQP